MERDRTTAATERRRGVGGRSSGRASEGEPASLRLPCLFWESAWCFCIRAGKWRWYMHACVMCHDERLDLSEIYDGGDHGKFDSLAIYIRNVPE